MTNKTEIVESVFGAALEGDLERMKEYTHPECTIHESESLPYGGTIRGEEAYIESLGRYNDVFEDFEFESQYLDETDDYVYVHFDLAATSEAGERVETTGVEVIKVKDEQIIEADLFYKDTSKLLNLFE